jgi:hypothetical protein
MKKGFPSIFIQMGTFGSDMNMTNSQIYSFFGKAPKSVAPIIGEGIHYKQRTGQTTY